MYHLTPVGLTSVPADCIIVSKADFRQKIQGFFEILASLCVGSVRRYSRSFVSCEMRSYCLLTRDKVKRLKGYRMSVQHNLP